MPKSFTDTEIKMRVVATRMRWPETGTTIAWSKLHDCVDLLHGLIGAVDNGCIEAERNIDLSPEGIARRRTELGRLALTELATFKPFQIAEKAALGNIEYLEKKMVDLPQPPTNIADVMMAQELRSYVRDQNSPIDFVMKSLSDARVLGAVLTAPGFLSGLTDVQMKVVRERARAALHPTQADMQVKLARGLKELREGIAATRRMLLERCELREDDDGEVRSIYEPLPKINLTEKAKKLKEATIPSDRTPPAPFVRTPPVTPPALPKQRAMME